ncbi:glycoside hydrolase family 65, partial [bacterium]
MRRSLPLTAIAIALMVAAAGLALAARPEKIDRFALVSRHNVTLTEPNFDAPLSVGNGEFAFTADVTGLQTFEGEYSRMVPLSTMTQWGFHASPNPNGFTLEKFPLTTIDTSGRPVGYLYQEDGKTPPEWGAAAGYLYSNPSRLNLGRIGFVLKAADGHEARLDELKDIRQTLNMWTGELSSHFVFDGEAVDVSTSCHPDRELLAVRVQSPLIAKGRLAVRLAFPYGVAAFNGNGSVWDRPDAHQTVLTRTGENRADFARTLDNDRYAAAMTWSKGSRLVEDGPHRFLLQADASTKTIEFGAAFSQTAVPRNLPTPAASRKAAGTMWKGFWSTGGAIDLSGSRDPRWKELERRIVLSQYLTRIQCAGSLPPQETGLTVNSWFGKFHLEMHWWHAAHFPLWDRSRLLENSLPYYQRTLPSAQAMAKSQGYEGARWPKCVGPSGEPAPTYLESFLIWQQPHPISFAELCYRNAPNRKTLEKYQELVFETAKFMASFAARDEASGQYRLGPPFADAAEVYFPDHAHQWNGTMEVAYWHEGLETAQLWRERLGLKREPKWDDVIAHLPPLATRDGLYVAAETATDTFTTPGRNISHPTMVAPLGMFDGRMVDRETMRRTLH